MTDKSVKPADPAPLAAKIEDAPAVPVEREKNAHEIAAEEEANQPHDERARRLLAAYEHGLASNSPRTSAELAELKALLLGDKPADEPVDERVEG